MAHNPGTNRQVPEHSIMDYYNKQNYLGNRYVYCVDNTPGATTEVATLYLANPAVSASAFPSGYVSLFVDLRQIAGETASATTIMRTYLNPTVSAGTSQTPINLRHASANTSIATLKLSPTASANGSLIESVSVVALGTEQGKNFIILDPGQSLLVTLQSSSNTAVVGVTLSWYEI